MQFQYEPEQLDVRTLPAMNKEDAKSLLSKMQFCTKEKGVDIFLAYGTLLGVVRDNNFINGDQDIDTYTKDEEAFFRILPFLRSKGLVLIRYRRGVSFSFRDIEHPGCFIDVFVVKRLCNIWGLYCYSLGSHPTPKKYLKQEGEIIFNGNTYKCPQNPVNILKFWYGETWNIPIAKAEKEYTYEVSSYHFYKVKIWPIFSTIFHTVFGNKLHPLKVKD